MEISLLTAKSHFLMVFPQKTKGAKLNPRYLCTPNVLSLFNSEDT